MSSRKNSSSTWNHFIKKDYGKAECRYCNEVFSYISTSTNLKNHLMRRHFEAYSKLVSPEQTKVIKTQNPQQQSECRIRIKAVHAGNMMTVDDLDAAEVSARSQNARKRHIDHDVLDMIIDGFHPFSLTEERAFLKLIRRIPEYKLPHRQRISGPLLQEVYMRTSTRIEEQVAKEVTTMCLTLDSWVTRLNETYIAISGHYISPAIEFKTILLDCCHFSDYPTSKGIAQEITGLIKEYNLENKINLIVSGDNPNVKLAIQDFLEWDRLFCYAHTLNSVVDGALKLIKGDIDQVKQVVGHMKKSTEESLAEKLIQPTDTRWNSTYYMLKRFIELEEEVQLTCAHVGKNWPAFRSDKWNTFSQVCQVLKPFEEITKVISNEKYLLGSSVIVVTRCLMETCNKMLTKDGITTAACNVVKALRDGLNKHFGDIEQNETLALCTFMDPRFKMQAFSNQTCAIKAKEKVQKLLTIEQTLEVNDTVEEVKIDPVIEEGKDEFSAWTIFDELVGGASTTKTPLSKAVQEIEMFLVDERLPRINKDGKSNCPFKWWKEHQNAYPNLSKLFIEKCNVVATSVPCERLFSKTGNIGAERRSMLREDCVEKLVFLNGNLPEDYFSSE